MLLTFLYWFYVALVTGITGLGLLLRVKRLYTGQKELPPLVPLPFYTLGGLAFYGVLANALSLLSPLNGWVHALPLLISLSLCLAEPAGMRLGLSLIGEHLRKWGWPEWLLLGGGLLTALYLSALPSQIIDDGIYYQQYIRWMKEYPVVPGLAHLNARFGFNSSWHSLEAFFNAGYGWGFRPSLTGLLQVLLALLATQGLSALRQHRARLYHYVALCALPLAGFLSKMLTAPTMDGAVAFMALILLLLFLRGRRQGFFHPYPALLLGLSLFALTLKLSALVLLGFAVYLALGPVPFGRGPRFWGALLGLLLAIYGPWLLRFYYLSGYLVFPLHELGLFAPDWKLPAGMVAEERWYIQGFARFKHLAYPRVMAMNLSEWLPRWYQEHWLLGRLQIAAGAGCLIAYLLFFILRALRGPLGAQRRALLAPLSIAVAGSLFWFFTAPALRFGMGYLFMGLALAGGQILLFLVSKWAISPRKLAGLTGVAISLLLVQRSLNEASTAGQGRAYPGLWQPGFPKTPRLEIASKDHGVALKKPRGTTACWDSPLPCVPFLPDGVRLRDSSLAGGFQNERFQQKRYRHRLIEQFQE
jgi:hypothetical protein